MLEQDIIDLSKFTKLEEIAKGSFLEVFKIRHNATGKIFAISKPYDIDEDNRLIILNMAIISKSIQHPSILRFIGFCPENLSIINEYMCNGTLNQIINLEARNISPRDWDDTRILINIYGIASAMTFLHSHDILHLDLKPSKIILDEYLYPKLAISCLTRHIESLPEKGIVGTPFFIAPEIFSDLKYSKASDVYAFGMTLFMLITKTLPCPNYGPSFHEKRKEKIESHFAEHPNHYPKAYKELIESCLAEDPSKRPSFNEIQDQLEKNHDFITEEIDEYKFFDYVDIVNSFPIVYYAHKNCLISNSKKEDDQNEPEKEDGSKKPDNYFIDELTEKEQYENMGRVGEGATSITYKLINKKTQKLLCKKVLKYNNGQTTIKDAQNALKEFQVLYQIDHPCICKAFFINTSEMIEIATKDKPEMVTTISIFLEFIDYSLSEFLASNLCNNTMKAKIVVEIAHAMNFIHKKGMIHRDLKIENIMLSSDLNVKLVDFGLVKINEFVLNEYSYINESLTKGVGTFAYMSPEMLNEEDYDNKTDVYSFGVVLYFILIGSIPKQKLKEKTAGKAIELPSASDKISKFGIKLIKKCLTPNPLKRPSFVEILSHLRMNSYQIANGVDSAMIAIRDKQLESIEKI